MDVILSLPSVTRADRKKFNCCCIHLKITFLSKICSADGTCIRRQFWIGSKPLTSSHLWPYQPCPGPQLFHVWHRLLAEAFLISNCPHHPHPATKDLSLHRQLRAWLPNFKIFQLPPTVGQLCHTRTMLPFPLHTGCLCSSLCSPYLQHS